MDHQLESTTTVSALAIQQLEETRPWVKFISILMFIGAGFMLLAAVFIILGGLIGSFGASANSEVASAAPAGAVMIGMGVVYAISSLIYIYPALKLWKYAGAITQLIASGSEQDLVHALDQQRGFWKFLGILMIVVLGIYVVAIVVAIIAMAFGAAMLG